MPFQRIKVLAIATVLGTLALTAWGMMFWGVLYEPVGVFSDVVIDEEIVVALDESGIETGTYFYPWPRNTADTQKAWLTRHSSGPFFRLSFVREGINPQSPVKLLRGTAHNALVVFLAAWLILVAKINEKGFGQRFLTVLLAGSIGTWMTWGGDAIWFHMPTDYAIGSSVYELVSWLLIGLVLAWYMAPSRSAA